MVSGSTDPILEGLHKFLFPVYIYVINGLGGISINSFIINYYNTTSDVGIYDFALKVVLLIDEFQTAVMWLLNNPRIYHRSTGILSFAGKVQPARIGFIMFLPMFSVIMIAVSISHHSACSTFFVQ